MRFAIARSARFTLQWIVALVVLFGQAQVALSQAPDTAVFGPTQYVRGAGPDERVEIFSIPAGIASPFRLRVQNGNPDGTQRATSGEIQLNGVAYARSNDFNRDVALIERSIVNIRPSNNRLEIKIKGQPGSRYTVTVLGKRIASVPTRLAPDPLSINAGASGTLTATLTPAPPAAGSLSVASANPNVASVSSSVAFAAGQTQVPIAVGGVAAGTTTVSASLNGTTVTATVQVTPAAPTVASVDPANLTVTQGAGGRLNVTISAAQPTATDVLLSSDRPDVARVASFVAVPAGQLSAQAQVDAVGLGSAVVTASLNGTSASSQITVIAAAPTVVSLVPAVSTVILGGSASLTLTISAAQSADTVVPLTVTPEGIITAPDSVTVLAGRTSVVVPIGTLAYGQAGITAILNASTASAAVNVVPPPVAVVALEPATFAMMAGATSRFTVSINAAQLTNTEITLAVDDPSVLQIPASVVVAQGQTSAVFTATALVVGNAVITASANGTEKTSSVHVSPQPAAVVSLLPNPLPLQQGATGSLIVTINVAQESDSIVTVANAAADVVQTPPFITIPAGALSAPIPVTALLPGGASVTAFLNNTNASSIVEVIPPPPHVTALAPATLTLPKGTPGTLTVSVSRAPSAATTVTLESSAPNVASVPPQVNIPAGALSADFPVVANAVSATSWRA